MYPAPAAEDVYLLLRAWILTGSTCALFASLNKWLLSNAVIRKRHSRKLAHIGTPLLIKYYLQGGLLNATEILASVHQIMFLADKQCIHKLSP